jgi:hypothetical protein
VSLKSGVDSQTKMGGEVMIEFRNRILCTLPVVALMWSVQPAVAQAQFMQQGPKLVGTGAIGPFGLQGFSVSLSGDGNTAIVGGPSDNASAGAAWVYTRTGGVWSQQAKLVGTGAIGRFGADQGESVSLSGDGNTAIVGGPGDDFVFGQGWAGAAWVYTRTGGVWTQQVKLVGTRAIGLALQGESVSLSGDGNIAIVGGPLDTFSAGAAWVFTRTGAGWTPQGAKLVGTGAIGNAQQGVSVSLSGDGNTAIVGGPGDNGSAGAAWIFTRTGAAWFQQAKLVGTGAIGSGSRQGASVSLSGDGNTAIVGGPGVNGSPSSAGAAWVFTRTGGVWSQQAKLVGTGAIGPFGAEQGDSVSLSGDGDTAIVGGLGDNGFAGAAWVFTRTGGVWTQQAKLVGTGAVGLADQGVSVSLSGDGNTAIVGGHGDNGSAGAAWVFAKPVFAGTPGEENCHGQSVSALARQFGGLNNAAAALGFPSVQALQDAIMAFCQG